MQVDLSFLKQQIKGELHTDKHLRLLYATDASVYREMPLAVAYPKNKNDIKQLITFAAKNQLSLIPRAAGTSLAGQVVGNGIVVDISRHFTEIQQLNRDEKWVKVQPGVIRDELNAFLQPHKLFFGPETSTSNRAMIGGMIGNNSCGSRSLIFGATRDHLISVDSILADGSEVTFGPLSNKELKEKIKGKNVSGQLEQDIYRYVFNLLNNTENQKHIRANYPKPNIPRRNTGYALDLLLRCSPFNTATDAPPFNLCRLIAGAEGTLAFITAAKLKLVDALPQHNAVMCVHFKTVQQALKANLEALKFKPTACELIDHYILECTQENSLQKQNAFFVKGTPGAILVVEFFADDEKAILKKTQALEKKLKAEKLGYHFPVLTSDDVNKVWDLRKAGLGLLSNIPGDAKPVAVIEDTAVDVKDLPAYIADFNDILKKHDLYCVHYAHAATGELHLRPIINLKTKAGNELFHTILQEIATLVKKYKGSLSGEHGDGRLRGEFISFMYGETITKWFEVLKDVWDKKHIFNPGKITHTPPMNSSLRYTPGQKTPQFNTLMSFEKEKGILRAAEMCNGSGDCRKTHLTGGTMCPSYMATRDEFDTTRARANMLREALTNDSNPFKNKELLKVLDLCLSCKGCKNECPSNVDMARMKAEFYYQHYKNKIKPLRSLLLANVSSLNRVASKMPGLYNRISNNNWVKKIMGFAPQRSIPKIPALTFEKWFSLYKQEIKNPIQEVYLFVDEFTAYLDVEVGIAAVEVLNKLGYKVKMLPVMDSGRAHISKGMLKTAKKQANKIVTAYSKIIDKNIPLIGLEPSAILSFADEYPQLVNNELKAKAQALAENVFLFEDFIALQAEKGNITAKQFTNDEKRIKIHGHCYQKALRSIVPLKKALSLPKNYTVVNIPSGCCGMAGSFGYEKEHYAVSMKIGELVLFPNIRNEEATTIIAAPGTSCRHQIKDGTGVTALHPAQILRNALR